MQMLNLFMIMLIYLNLDFEVTEHAAGRCIFFFFQLLFSIASAKKAQYSIRVTKSTQKNARTVTQCLTTAPANDCKYLPIFKI